MKNLKSFFAAVCATVSLGVSSAFGATQTVDGYVWTYSSVSGGGTPICGRGGRGTTEYGACP